MADGSETWIERQNSPGALAAIGAADQYWTVVQRGRALEAAIFVFLPTMLAVLAQFIQALGTMAATIGFSLTILDAVFAYPLITAARRRAAQAQDRFDSIVFDLPNSPIRQMNGPDISEIRAVAAAQNKKRSTRNSNWYTVGLGGLPITLGRIACMREATAWDGGLRSRYVQLVIALIVLVFLSFPSYGVFEKLTMVDFTVRILFPLTPAILWAGREVWDQHEAAEAVSRLRETLGNLWSAATTEQLESDQIAAQTIELRSALFAYRQATPPVPDIFYGIFRAETTRSMAEATEDELAEYERSRSRT